MTTPKRPRYSNQPPPSNPNNSTINTLLESLIIHVTDQAFIDDSIDRIIDSKSTDSEQNDVIQRVIDFGSVLFESGNRVRRNRASVHNAIAWPFDYEVTVKVFSKMDTGSVCNAAATCSFFNKCATDPLCYADIDLVTQLVPKANDDVVLTMMCYAHIDSVTTLVPKANDDVVSTMIYRAGNALRSIKLGVLPYDEREEKIGVSNLTSSCLNCLNGNSGALGLRRLHLYNIIGMDNTVLSASLSVCPSLVDLEIVCSNVTLVFTLECVSKHIPLIERLIIEASPKDKRSALEESKWSEFVLNCPNITTLALKGFKLSDSVARKLVEALHKLKYVNFSTSSSFTGSFLENLGTIGGGNNLEVMILRDTENLSNEEVKKFMAALVAGEWRSLTHLDISHNGRKIFSSFKPFCTSSIRKQLLEQRPNFRLVAEFGNRSAQPEVFKRVRAGADACLLHGGEVSSMASNTL